MKLLFSIALLLGLPAGALWLANDLLGRRLGVAEVALAGAVLAALGARWFWVVRRRQRQKLEEMRDSALW